MRASTLLTSAAVLLLSSTAAYAQKACRKACLPDETRDKAGCCVQASKAATVQTPTATKGPSAEETIEWLREMLQKHGSVSDGRFTTTVESFTNCKLSLRHKRRYSEADDNDFRRTVPLDAMDPLSKSITPNEVVLITAPDASGNYPSVVSSTAFVGRDPYARNGLSHAIEFSLDDANVAARVQKALIHLITLCRAAPKPAEPF